MGVGEGEDCGGSGYDGPRRGLSSHSSVGQGVGAITMVVSVLFQSFVWQWM